MKRIFIIIFLAFNIHSVNAQYQFKCRMDTLEVNWDSIFGGSYLSHCHEDFLTPDTCIEYYGNLNFQQSKNLVKSRKP